MSKDGFCSNCLWIILIHFVFKTSNSYPQAVLEKCKYIAKVKKDGKIDELETDFKNSYDESDEKDSDEE